MPAVDGRMHSPHDAPAGPVVTTSRHSYDETVTRLIAAIGAAGSTLFAAIDQRAAAQSAGLELRPTMLLIFGNPRGGTPLMDARPLFALELPLKLLVWQAGSDVYVGYMRASAVALPYELAEHAAQLAGLDAAQARIAASIA